MLQTASQGEIQVCLLIGGAVALFYHCRKKMTLPDGVRRVVCLGITHYHVNVFKGKHEYSTCTISFCRYHQDWDGTREPTDEQISITGLPYRLTTTQTEKLLCKLQMMRDFSKVAPRLLMSDSALNRK